MGTGTAIGLLVAWLLLLALARRLVYARFKSQRWGIARSALVVALVWAVVPFGFEVLGPDSPNLGLATLAAALLGLGAFLGTANGLKMATDSWARELRFRRPRVQTAGLEVRQHKGQRRMARVGIGYRERIEKMTRRQAVIGLTLGLLVLVAATASFLVPRAYMPGDVRGETWFKVATVAAMFFFSLWVIVPSLVRLRKPS